MGKECGIKCIGPGVTCERVDLSPEILPLCYNSISLILWKSVCEREREIVR
jgi:hypothetical protein